MRRLSALDLAFFLAETEASPKHVAGLLLFAKPAGARAAFCRKLVAELRTHDRPTEPFDRVIRFGGLAGPRWEPATDFDIDRHVFYHKPAGALSWAAVLDRVATLHEPLMDRSRPLWEYHVIDGVEGRKFAVYFRAHHAYADGMTMTTWLERSLSDAPDDPALRPVWAMPAARRRPPAKHLRRPPPSLLPRLRDLGRLPLAPLRTTAGIAKLAAQQALERAGITRKAVSLQFATAHDTPMTGSATPGRGIATTALPMAAVKAACRASRATLNHVALTCIDGAMHRYLARIGHAPDHPLTIQMPVSLRHDGAGAAGNVLGVGLVELGQPDADPLQRLQEIGHSLHKVRNQLDSVSSHAVQQYTVICALATELIDKVKLSDRIPATGHTLVSNVAGPPHDLYLKGARLLQNYPLSILVPGLRSNITMFSCSGTLNFGIVATRDLVHLDRLADAIPEEFANLQRALGLL
jgi:WS/DGAT/MGAT family acyltransferase